MPNKVRFHGPHVFGSQPFSTIFMDDCILYQTHGPCLLSPAQHSEPHIALNKSCYYSAQSSKLSRHCLIFSRMIMSVTKTPTTPYPLTQTRLIAPFPSSHRGPPERFRRLHFRPFKPIQPALSLSSRSYAFTNVALALMKRSQ